MDFSSERQLMVEEQLISRGVSDPAVLAAFRAVPREKFVPPHLQNLSYIDAPLDIGEGQTISQPYTVAAMTELLELKPSDKVLEVGTGSGYQAAILAEVVRQGKVFSVERIESLAARARNLLKKLDYLNVEVLIGDGSKGLTDLVRPSDQVLFDAIIVTAAAPKIPQPLIEQLAAGGRLVAPIGGDFLQEMIRVTKNKDGSIKEERFGGYRFVPLVGEYGVKT